MTAGEYAMNDSITPQSAMRRVLEIYPGAQRALFRRFHMHATG
jgi:hypothetical protein